MYVRTYVRLEDGVDEGATHGDGAVAIPVYTYNCTYVCIYIYICI